MFDIPITQPSLETTMFCLVVYIFILSKNYKRALGRPFTAATRSENENLNICLVGFIFIIFCKTGDFFHLIEVVHNYDFTPGAWNYGEDIYREIGKLTNKNYFLFRTVVWGGAFALYCWTAKRLEQPVYYTVMFLFCSYIILFVYARATAAMAVYFWGLSFLCKPIEGFKWLSYVLGIIIIYASLLFHNSAVIMMFMTVMLLVPLRKWSIVIILIGLPAIIIAARGFFNEVMIYMEDANEIAVNKMQYYLDSERGGVGISEKIMNILKYASFYIPFTIITIAIFTQKKFKKVPIQTIRMYKVAFGIILTSSIFYLFGDSFHVMFYRVLYMSMIPITLIAISLRKEKIITQGQFKWCYMPGIIFSIVNLTYDVYAIITVS